MKFTNLLLGLALASPSLCAADAVTAVEALYYWTVYDLDVEVWGVRKGYIAPKCRGTGKDNRCTFDEFVNFIEFDDPSGTPSYYDMQSGYSLTIGDVGVIVAYMQEHIPDRFQTLYENLVPGRKGPIGVWNDLGFALDKGAVQGAAKDIDVGRHLRNAHMVLGAVSEIRSAALNPALLKQVKANVKDVIWQIVEKESQYAQKPWQEVDWEKTVEKYPDMKDPKSKLFQEVTKELNSFYNNKDNAKSLTIKQKITNSLSSCFQ